MTNLTKTLVLFILSSMVSCSVANKIIAPKPDASKPKKIGSLVFYTGTKNPFEVKREKDTLSVVYKIRVKNLSKQDKKLNLSYSSLFINNKKIPVECFDYKRKMILTINNKNSTTIFCMFTLNRAQPKESSEVKKDKVKVLLSIDGLESIRFKYGVKLESAFL